MKKMNAAKQQNEQLAEALLTPRAEDKERISARAGRLYVCIKEKNADDFRKRLLGAHRIGVNANGRKGTARIYPVFEAGKTTTALYVEMYQRCNSNVSKWKFTHADGPAPTYADGAFDFDPVEEHEQGATELVADLL